jgi:hypothetical protein
MTIRYVECGMSFEFGIWNSEVVRDAGKARLIPSLTLP